MGEPLTRPKRGMPLGVRAALLASIPLVSMAGIGIALLAQGKTADGRSTLAVGVIVAALCGAATIYWVKRWTLAQQTLVHAGVMAVTALPAMIFSGWFPLDQAWGWGAILGVYVLGGVVGWTVGFITTRPRGSAGGAG